MASQESVPPSPSEALWGELWWLAAEVDVWRCGDPHHLRRAQTGQSLRDLSAQLGESRHTFQCPRHKWRRPGGQLCGDRAGMPTIWITCNVSPTLVVFGHFSHAQKMFTFWVKFLFLLHQNGVNLGYFCGTSYINTNTKYLSHLRSLWSEMTTIGNKWEVQKHFWGVQSTFQPQLNSLW